MTDAIEPTDQIEVGDLWKAIVNHVGLRPVVVDDYLPILHVIGPRFRHWTYFLGWVGTMLETPTDLAEIEADWERARLGVRIWESRRDRLLKWANASGHGPFTEEQLRAWWFDEERIEANEDTEARRKAFLRIMTFDETEMAVIESHPDIPSWEPGKVPPHLSWLRGELPWVGEIEMLRTLAAKTWPADPKDREPWTSDELEWVNNYYGEQKPELFVPGDPEKLDPFELDSLNRDQDLGIGLDGLAYCMYVLMRAAVSDFVDEILERRRRGLARGSLRCIECGLFVGRRALGYGQLYCGDQCKKRAAKRRYRSRVRIAGSRPLAQAS